MLFTSRKATIVTPQDALPGRALAVATAETHFINGHALKGPYPAGMETIIFALGCYWGAERKFWTIPGIWVTAVGNAGGFTPNPTYAEVCTGQTGHAESVLVVFDPKQVALEYLLKTFFEAHDPTQYLRQGNDIGSQYRSAIYWTNPVHEKPIRKTARAYDAALATRGHGAITTELAPAGPFYFAEEYHQQYLAIGSRLT